MNHKILIPALNEGDDSGQGTIIGIPVAVGDEINEGDTVLEIETDKVTVEVPCPYSGTIIEIHVTLDDDVGEGVHCFTLSTLDNIDMVSEQKQTSIELDDVGLHETTPIIDVLPEVSSDPKLDPKLKQKNVEPQPMMAADRDVSLQHSAVPAGPSTRRLARELGLDIANIPLNSTARLSPDDIKAYAKSIIQSGPSSQADRMMLLQTQQVSGEKNNKPIRNLPDVTKYGVTRSEKLSKIAMATSKNMSNAWSTIPHAWLQERIDITELEAWRQAQKKEGVKLTITVLIAKAMAVALKQFPKMNSSFDELTQSIIFKEYIDVGLAVDTPHGLVVPGLRGVDTKGLLDLSREVSDLSRKANERKLTPADLQGAGITLSNLGGIGLTSIFPIVNWPQVAIIGVASSEMVPKLINGELNERRMVTLTLGFDHRIINGAEGARFLVHIKELLEDIRRLII